MKIPYFLPGKPCENHKNVKIPYFSPFIIVNSESSLNFKEEEELTITNADDSTKTENSRFLGENHNNPAFSDGEQETGNPGLPDPGESARLEALTEALREAGIKPNNRTRPLFASDFLTGSHVAGYASRLRGYYGSGYRTNILIGVLESLRPGDSAPERGRSLMDILCPKCFCSPCHCGDEVDGADWEEQEEIDGAG